MQKERAASALKHGLPAPAPESLRPWVGKNVPARPPSNAPSVRRPDARDRRMPLAVKLLGAGLLLLGLIYAMTLFRDHRIEPERTRAPASVP
jgi:hypothetical protein